MSDVDDKDIARLFCAALDGDERSPGTSLSMPCGGKAATLGSKSASWKGKLAAEEAETVGDWEIGRALETSTPGQRSVVTAISVEGRTIAEAASSLDMNETAVRVALHRGLAGIARRLGRN